MVGRCNTPVSWDNPIDSSSGWARSAQGNGRENGKNKEKFKSFLRQT
jgi:hypothetical protein